MMSKINQFVQKIVMKSTYQVQNQLLECVQNQTIAKINFMLFHKKLSVTIFLIYRNVNNMLNINKQKNTQLK